MSIEILEMVSKIDHLQTEEINPILDVSNQEYKDNELRLDPDILNIYRGIDTPETYIRLKRILEEDGGIRDAITVVDTPKEYRGVVVKGCGRYKYHVETGAKLPTIIWKKYKDKTEMLIDAKRDNDGRRNLSDLDLLLSELNLLKALKKLGSDPPFGGYIVDYLSDITGMSNRNVERVLYIIKTEPKRIQEVREGKTTISGLEKNLREKEVQNKRLEHLQQEFISFIEKSVMRQSLHDGLRNKYSHIRNVEETKNIENLRKEIFRELGQPIGETVVERYRSMIEALKDVAEETTISPDHYKLNKWFEGNRRYVQLVLWIDEIDAINSLEYEGFPEKKFKDFEEADAYAKSRGGYCSGLSEYGGRKTWVLLINKESN